MAAISGLTEKVDAQGQYIESQQTEQAEAQAYQIAGLTEEQAAELGIDAEDLAAAQEFIAEVEGDEGLASLQQETQAHYAQGEGGEGGEGYEGGEGGEGAIAAEAGTATATAMSALIKQVTNLTAKLDAKDLAVEKAAINAEFAEIDKTILELTEKAKKVTELQSENSQLKKALSGAGRRPIPTNFSAAGTLVNPDEAAFESKVAKRITELTAKDSTMTPQSAKAKAWHQCISEDPDGYTEFRAGGKVTNL
jgi:hypothetical protein